MINRGICYIVAAAEADYRLPEIDICKNDLLLAADAGCAVLEKNGYKADIALGDFDSLGRVPDGDGFPVIKHPSRKNDTDTMLAVKEGMKRGYGIFVILNGVGGARPDHTMANLQTLLYISGCGGRGYLFGSGFGYTSLTNSSLLLRGYKKDETVSVFCAGKNAYGVSEKGMSYSLDNAALTSSDPLGVSNAFTGEDAEIGVADGSLFVFWQTDYERLIKTVRLNDKT